ncbi:hypothetical protein [Methylorubrum extorquens]
MEQVAPPAGLPAQQGTNATAAFGRQVGGERLNGGHKLSVGRRRTPAPSRHVLLNAGEVRSGVLGRELQGGAQCIADGEADEGALGPVEDFRGELHKQDEDSSAG